MLYLSDEYETKTSFYVVGYVSGTDEITLVQKNFTVSSLAAEWASLHCHKYPDGKLVVIQCSLMELVVTAQTKITYHDKPYSTDEDEDIY
jgi:hypothetical protein